MANPFRLMDVARLVADDVNRLLDEDGDNLLHVEQLRRSSDSIVSNIREAYGRRPGKERNLYFRFAHGSAEETDEHLRGNFITQRLVATRYWRNHNRIAVIKRMLDALKQGPDSPT